MSWLAGFPSTHQVWSSVLYTLILTITVCSPSCSIAALVELENQQRVLSLRPRGLAHIFNNPNDILVERLERLTLLEGPGLKVITKPMIYVLRILLVWSR
jgi:hypothetical protein